ncbi:MAG TPA: hypothetical protein VF509_15380 [Sphingobium sp.]
MDMIIRKRSAIDAAHRMKPDEVAACVRRIIGAGSERLAARPLPSPRRQAAG